MRSHRYISLQGFSIDSTTNNMFLCRTTQHVNFTFWCTTFFSFSFFSKQKRCAMVRSVGILPWPKCRNLTCGLMIWFVRHSNHRFSTMYPTSHLNGGWIIWWCASAIDLQKSQYYLNIFCLCIFEYPFLNNQPVSKRRTSR